MKGIKLIYGLNALNVASFALHQIVTVPFYLYYLGIGDYELWTWASSIGFIAMALDFGAIAYTTNATRIALGVGDKLEAQKGVGYGATYFLFSFGLFGLGALIALLCDTKGLGVVFAFILLNVPVYQLKSWLSGILTAKTGQTGELAFSIAIVIVQTVAFVGTVAVGGKLLALAAIQLATNIFCGVVPIWFVLRRAAPEIEYMPRLVPRKEWRAVLHGCLSNFGYSATVAAINYLPITLLGLIPRLPPGCLATFTVSRTLTGIVRQFCQQMARSSGIEISRFLASEHKDYRHRLFLMSAVLVSVVAASGMGGLLPIADIVLNLWTQKPELYNPAVIGLFALAAVLSAQVQLPMALPQVTNTAHIVIVPLFLQLALLIVLGFPGGYFFNAEGMIVAISLAELSTLGQVSVRKILPSLGLRPGRFLGIQFSVSAAAFVLAYVVSLACRAFLEPASFKGLILDGALWSLAMAPCGILFLWAVKRYPWDRFFQLETSAADCER